MIKELLAIIVLLFMIGRFLNWLDYRYMKSKYLKQGRFDLNICCGNTSIKGMNADIIKRNVPNFVLIKNIYKLPFKNKQFKNIISSHTIEHVDDPKKFYKELRRVSENVTLLIPPLWDYGCMFNFWEHRWQFLTLKSKHINELPRYFPLLFAKSFQKRFGQKNA